MLNAQTVFSLAEARRIVEALRQDYNTVRPHSSLGGMSPEEYRRAVRVKTLKARLRTYLWDTWRGKVTTLGEG